MGRGIGRVLGRARRAVARVRWFQREVARIQRENAAILRLLGGPRPLPPEVGPGGSTVPVGLSRRGLFAELERGSREEVARRVARYVERLRGSDPVVDLGCGRGEFLELACRAGLSAYGVDADPEAVAYCRELGLDVRQEDILAHLAGLPDGGLGGVVCVHVVEHLPPDRLAPFVGEVARVLRPGGVAIFETPNPATFATHVHGFWVDPTHLRPVPEPALTMAVRSAGMVVEEVVHTSPAPEEERLKPLAVRPRDPELRAIVEGVNALARRLNDVLFGFQDYAVVARRPD